MIVEVTKYAWLLCPRNMDVSTAWNPHVSTSVTSLGFGGWRLNVKDPWRIPEGSLKAQCEAGSLTFIKKSRVSVCLRKPTFGNSWGHEKSATCHIFRCWIKLLPSGKRLHNYGESPFLMGKLTINGNSYVKLPEGNPVVNREKFKYST